LYNNYLLFFQQLVFTTESGKDYKNRIFSLNLNNDEMTEYRSPVFNIRPISVLSAKNGLSLLTFSDINRKNNPVAVVNLTKKSSQLKKLPAEKIEDNYYTKWITTKHKNIIKDNPKMPKIIAENDYNSFKTISPFAILPLATSEGMILSSFLMDPLGKHTFALSAYSPYDFNFDNSFYTINYINRLFYPELIFNFSKYEWLMGINDSKFYYQDVKRGYFEVKLPVNYLNKPFWNLDYSFGFSYKDISRSDDSSDSLFIFENGTKTELSANFNLEYDLPFVNSLVHPIKQFSISYNLLTALKDIGMNYNFVHHKINTKFGYAPLYSSFGFDYLSLSSKIKYEWVNGKDLAQDLPGIDKFENIPIEEIFNNKTFLRGNKETINGNKLFSNSNEIWLKSPENMLKPFNAKLISIDYLGLGGFLDYSLIENKKEKTKIKTFGWELKSVINLLGTDTEHRLGQAYGFDNKEEIGFYYQAKIIMEF